MGARNCAHIHLSECQSLRRFKIAEPRGREFGKFLAAETDKWAKVIHDADLKLME
jgi:hypothetical protein